MSYRIFVTGSGLAQTGLRLLTDAGCRIEQGTPSDSASDIIEKVSRYRPHGLIVRQGKISAEVMDACANLRVISKHGTGIDNIDVAAASERRIPVMYTPDATFEAAAEHTLALILSLSRQIAGQDRRIRRGDFDKSGFSGQELPGKVLGLIGFGRIARRLAELVAPLGMEVLAYHPSCTREKLPAHVAKQDSADSVFRQSDYVSLHLPLTVDTTGLVDSGVLATMKKSAFLINTSRGKLVIEKDLIEALEKGTIAGAAIDTFETEPLPRDNPLCRLDNVVLTMHTAGNSDASLDNMATGSATHALMVLNRDPIDRHACANWEALNP